jgi:hypothetical protein
VVAPADAPNGRHPSVPCNGTIRPPLTRNTEVMRVCTKTLVVLQAEVSVRCWTSWSGFFAAKEAHYDPKNGGREGVQRGRGGFEFRDVRADRTAE